MSSRGPSGWLRSFVQLVAVRGFVLALMLALLSLGLYATPHGAKLRAHKALYANGPLPEPAHCPTVVPERGAKLASPELDEVSGMAASREQRELYWVHNDSGDDARIFAIDRTGALRAEVRLDGVEARDFEDIALWSSSGVAPDVLYVADTGDNFKRREQVRILRLPEPTVPRGSAPLVLHRSVEVTEIQYEDGPHDVEAMLVDVSGDVYLVEKGSSLSRYDPVGVYLVTAAEMRGKRARARRVAELMLRSATAAALRADRGAVAVRNYSVALYWPLRPEQSLADVFREPPCHFRLREAERGEPGESLTFLPDGSGLLSLSEGKHPPFVFFALRPPAPKP